LGLEAQRAAVATYLNGGNWSIVAEFTEVESGRKSDRPELDKALTWRRPLPRSRPGEDASSHFGGLNAAGIPTLRGHGKWRPVQVKRTLEAMNEALPRT
jgi:hypothetical protein